MTRNHILDLEGLRIHIDQHSDVDALFDELLAKGDDSEEVRDERIPYWADLWPSALAMGEYLVRSGLVTPDTTVTEIGCGLGLPGIVAGMLGAKEVIFTDYLEEALAFAQKNWSLNCSGAARFERMDWRAPNPAFAADLLLASDVAYEQRFFQHLPQAFRTLTRSGGRILFSEPGREVAKAFLTSLPQMGFEVKKTMISGEWNNVPYQAGIYELNPG